MSRLNEHFGNLTHEIHEMNQHGHIKEADEFVAINDLEKTIHQTRQVFERNRKFKENK